MPARLNITVSEEAMHLPASIQESIDSYWASLEERGHSFYRGDIFSIKEMKQTEDELNVTLERTDFAHFIYSKHCCLPDRYKCRVAAVNGLILTADNQFVMGEMNGQTANPGYVQFVAGGIDRKDIKGNKVDVRGSLFREMEEEIGIDGNDASLVLRVEPRYIVYWGNISLVYVIRLKERAAEFQERYRRFERSLRERDLTPEFASMVYVPGDAQSVSHFLELDGRPKWPFLRLVLEEELKDREW